MTTRKKYILITGGAGYIGSHAYLAFKKFGYEPIIIDNFSNSYVGVIHNLEMITGKKYIINL